ncbi:MAG: hypothetical protein ACK58J_13625 [Planctomyces sp.]
MAPVHHHQHISETTPEIHRLRFPRLRHPGLFLLLFLLLTAGRSNSVLAQTTPVAPSFLNDILPLLTRYDCNSGGCHGKLAGQNGFRLSLRGFAPEADYESLTRESRGRRINPASPESSLLVGKANGSIVHAGGRRIERGSEAET